MLSREVQRLQGELEQQQQLLMALQQEKAAALKVTLKRVWGATAGSCVGAAASWRQSYGLWDWGRGPSGVVGSQLGSYNRLPAPAHLNPYRPSGPKPLQALRP